MIFSFNDLECKNGMSYNVIESPDLDVHNLHAEKNPHFSSDLDDSVMREFPPILTG